jgi:hypothetical protein
MNAQHSSPVLVIRWSNKKNVTMISAYHRDETHTVSNRGKNKIKPVCVLDYNQYMGGVDLKD